jgi:dTDP-4-dehydrorhamnose 3,5-epimerase
MKVSASAIPEVKVLEPDVFGDERGFFLESWNRERFAEAGIDADFVQDNHSRSVRGTLRGLHYQVERPQGKLVQAVSGTVFDVVVDLRRSSPTYGRWVSFELSGDDHQMVWIPAGFAHGFYVLSAEADFLYKCTDYYSPELDRTIAWNDPELAIDWPVPAGEQPLVSGKDQQGSSFATAETYA